MTDKRLQAVIDHPLHQALGITDIRSEAGAGALDVIVGEANSNPAGVLHGGVLYLLCDVCAYAGLLSVLDEDREAVTHDIHVSAMRPARPGQTLRVSSTPIRIGRRIAFIDVSACVDKTTIATARVTKTLLGTG